MKNLRSCSMVAPDDIMLFQHTRFATSSKYVGLLFDFDPI